VFALSTVARPPARAPRASRPAPAAPWAAVHGVPPWLVAAALALLWLAAAPRTPDLAAQNFRAGVFAREGWAVWNPWWFAGHHLPGYSLLSGPLGALLGPRVLGAACAVASTILFARLATAAFGARARLGTLWFAVASVADLCIGRITYALGVTLGLAALAALGSRRPRLAGLLGVACAAGSPVAGAFLALAGAAVVLARALELGGAPLKLRPRDPLVRGAAGMAAASLATVGALALAFPEGGDLTMPFAPSVAVVGACLAVLALLPRAERSRRIGGVLYRA